MRLPIQHAGPKLTGYRTSTTTAITVAQNAMPGLFWGSAMPAIVPRREEGENAGQARPEAAGAP